MFCLHLLCSPLWLLLVTVQLEDIQHNVEGLPIASGVASIQAAKAQVGRDGPPVGSQAYPLPHVASPGTECVSTASPVCVLRCCRQAPSVSALPRLCVCFVAAARCNLWMWRPWRRVWTLSWTLWRACQTLAPCVRTWTPSVTTSTLLYRA